MGKGVDYKVFTTDKDDKFSFQFEPKNTPEVKSVNIKYDGVPLKGTPIILKKRVPTYTLDSKNNKVKSSTEMEYELYSDLTTPTTYHLFYKNPGNYKNKLYLSYGDQKLNKEPLEIGKVEKLKPGTLLFSSNKLETSDTTETAPVEGSDLVQRQEPIVPRSRESRLRNMSSARTLYPPADEMMSKPLTNNATTDVYERILPTEENSAREYGL